MENIKNREIIETLRREYGNLSLTLKEAAESPFVQFTSWFDEISQIKTMDASAMVLSTCDTLGHPDARIVLLKGIEKNNFIFYTNYASAKGNQIKENSFVALTFYWPELARQVRIKGRTKKVSPETSDLYFAKRPILSQINALLSPQSRPLSSRIHLEEQMQAYYEKNKDKVIARPDHWGGYQVTPFDFEFWQGRDNRCHDRIHYFQQEKKWRRECLAP